MDQTDKIVQATMDCLDKYSTERANLLKALNGVTETLKVVHEAVKDDPALNMKVIKATEAYTKNSTSLSELFTLIKNFDFQGLKSSVESLQATAITIEISQAKIRTEISSLKSDTSEIKSMMTEIYQAFKGQSSAPSSSVPQTTLAITEGPANKLVSASKVIQEDQNEPIRVPYMINGKMHYLTNDDINAHLEKEDKIKKAAEEAKRLEMTKTKVIKIVQEEAEKIGIDPKKIISAKACEKFKKAQDAEMQVYKRQHTEKAKRLMELNKKRAEQYKWTISSRLKPEPAVLTVYRNNDKRNFDVHNPFKFTDFGLTELDELELGIQSALPDPIPEQAPSQSSGRKRKHVELEPEIRVHGLECNQSLPKGVPFVNNMVIKEPEYGIFFNDVFGDQAFQRWNDINKVRVESLVSYLVMASMIKTLENARFCLKLKKLIAKHPNQEKLQSEKVKLESVGYKLD
ncbi:hypothetical protein Tco_0523815 [Tanacetum coccineum]